MDYIKVLNRAWHLVWRYRVLWVFGVILALTTGGGFGSGLRSSFNREDFERGGRFRLEQISPEVVSTLIAVGIGLVCLILILIVVTTIARYVAETALIRMVDDHEETGERRSARQGFRMGWSRTALRLFLIDLLISLPTVLVFILLFVLAAAPLLLWATGSKAAGAIGTLAAIGLILLVVLLAIVVGVVLSLLFKFFFRACALEELGVIESIRHGYRMVRRHLKDAVVMWLIMASLTIGWVLVMIPVAILVFILALALGGLPGLLAGGLASLVSEGAVPWIVGAAVGVPIFLLALVAPLAFLGGLWEVFKSSVWTLTYRELRARAAPVG
jgi:hypothetical protein